RERERERERNEEEGESEGERDLSPALSRQKWDAEIYMKAKQNSNYKQHQYAAYSHQHFSVINGSTYLGREKGQIGLGNIPALPEKRGQYNCMVAMVALECWISSGPIAGSRPALLESANHSLLNDGLD
ncbi:unnamed protein product, partial [Gadus morhua 'NCC']